MQCPVGAVLVVLFDVPGRARAPVSPVRRDDFETIAPDGAAPPFGDGVRAERAPAWQGGEEAIA